MNLFPPSSNPLARLTIILFAIAVIAAGFFLYVLVRSPYLTRVNIVQDQPIPFSHKHHVDGLGIDCRFCHASVENSSFAGMPSTETCMKCHSVIWSDSPMLEPVRESFRTGKPLAWNRVHNLADHVFFDHSIHVRQGISCVRCHGRVDKMPLVWKSESMQMAWCLSCHRQPEKFIRPREQVFNMEWAPGPGFNGEARKQLAEAYRVESMIHCNACHR
jgi:hypothetical protein